MGIVRDVLALPAGIIAGSVVNMGLVMLGPLVVPPPPGVDVTSAASIAASIHLFEARHYVFPFLAHALGTFAGAGVACLLAARFKTIVAFALGVLSFAGGVAASRMIPAPASFVAIDLVFAYFPMAWLAILACRGRPQARHVQA